MEDIIKVILADSNELIRMGLQAVFSNESRIDIIAEATDEKQLKQQCKSLSPDLIIIDYTSEGFSIDVIPQILTKYPEIKFTAITYEQSARTVVNALKSGVTSHVKKDCDLQEIRDSVVETANGKKFFCGKILETIQVDSIDVNDIEFDELSCAPVMISDRELEIIQLIAEGYTNNQIAEKLFLSNHTINTHRKNIMSKLGVKNTAGIVMYAVKTNLVSPNKFLFAAQDGVE